MEDKDRMCGKCRGFGVRVDTSRECGFCDGTGLGDKLRGRIRSQDFVYLREVAKSRRISVYEALKLAIEHIEAESAKTGKTIGETKERRVYRTPDGYAVSCSLQHQREYDPDDGQQAGWYGWCGAVEEQSDYMIGPYESANAVFAAYERRHPKHQRVAAVKLHRGFIGPDNRFHGKGPEFIPVHRHQN